MWRCWRWVCLYTTQITIGIAVRLFFILYMLIYLWRWMYLPKCYKRWSLAIMGGRASIKWMTIRHSVVPFSNFELLWICATFALYLVCNINVSSSPIQGFSVERKTRQPGVIDWAIPSLPCLVLAGCCPKGPQQGIREFDLTHAYTQTHT